MPGDSRAGASFGSCSMSHSRFAMASKVSPWGAFGLALGTRIDAGGKLSPRLLAGRLGRASGSTSG